MQRKFLKWTETGQRRHNYMIETETETETVDGEKTERRRTGRPKSETGQAWSWCKALSKTMPRGFHSVWRDCVGGFILFSRSMPSGVFFGPRGINDGHVSALYPHNGSYLQSTVFRNLRLCVEGILEKKIDLKKSHKFWHFFVGKSKEMRYITRLVLTLVSTALLYDVVVVGEIFSSMADVETLISIEQDVMRVLTGLRDRETQKLLTTRQ